MFVITKRTIMFLSVVLASVLIFTLCIFAISATSINATSGAYTVIIDAGHGGVDCGVVGVNSGVKESDLNLEVAKELQEVFDGLNVNTVLTRSSEAGLYGTKSSGFKKRDMQKRKEIIEQNEHDIVISLHMNYYSLPSRRGAQTFYYSKDKNDDKLAKSVQSALNGMPSASRSCDALYGDYYILKCSKSPSVIIECGFLSNPEDEALLLTKEYRKELAESIASGTIAYLISQ